MEYRPIFFRQMTEAFLVRTEPDSSMVKPAHIHMTSAPQIRKEKVLRTNCVSLSHLRARDRRQNAGRQDRDDSPHSGQVASATPGSGDAALLQVHY